MFPYLYVRILLAFHSSLQDQQIRLVDEFDRIDAEQADLYLLRDELKLQAKKHRRRLRSLDKSIRRLEELFNRIPSP